MLLVDLPPGTGDVQLTMLQKLQARRRDHRLDAAGPGADRRAARAIDLFETGRVPLIGLVENMAGYACPHCGEISDPFGAGGVEARGREATGMPFLGRIPLAIAIREASDAGDAAGGGRRTAGRSLRRDRPAPGRLARRLSGSRGGLTMQVSRRGVAGRRRGRAAGCWSPGRSAPAQLSPRR